MLKCVWQTECVCSPKVVVWSPIPRVTVSRGDQFTRAASLAPTRPGGVQGGVFGSECCFVIEVRSLYDYLSSCTLTICALSCTYDYSPIKMINNNKVTFDRLTVAATWWMWKGTQKGVMKSCKSALNGCCFNKQDCVINTRTEKIGRNECGAIGCCCWESTWQTQWIINAEAPSSCPLVHVHQGVGKT